MEILMPGALGEPEAVGQRRALVLSVSSEATPPLLSGRPTILLYNSNAMVDGGLVLPVEI